MNNRVIAFGAILLSAAIVALGWFLGVSPRLADAAAADAERLNVQSQNEGLEAQLVQLRADYKRIDQLRDEVGELRASIPDIADYAGFVSELNALSGGSGAGVYRLTIGDASWYASQLAEEPVTADPVAPPAGSASADGTLPSETSEPETVEGPIPVPIDTTLINGSNFVAIPVTLELAADYDQSMALMTALQADKRLFLVTGFSWGGAAAPRIEGLLYVLLS